MPTNKKRLRRTKPDPISMPFEQFKRLVDTHLLQFFPGSKSLGDTDKPGEKAANVAKLAGGTKMALRPSKQVNYRVVVSRKQKFVKEEQKIIEEFIRLFSKFEKIWDTQYIDSILSKMMTRVIGQWLSTVTKQQDILFNILNKFEQWSQETYEGERIACAIGLDPEIGNSQGPFIDKVFENDFAKVFTNGMDTSLIVDSQGNVTCHLSTSPNDQATCCPFRWSGLSEWADNGKICISLNRNGEILLFSNGQLKFAKRRGKWIFFPHDSLIRSLAAGKKRSWAEEVRTAVYESCLDVSFARSGACVGLIKRNMTKDVDNMITKNDNFKTCMPTNVKPAFYKAIIEGKKFQDLPRQLRKEILSVDGATVLDSHGHFIAAGAILKIPPGSDGGARQAAAKALAKCGVGIKVSHDGGITVFSSLKEGEEVDEIFRFG